MGNNKPLLWTAILTAAGTGSAMAQITGTPTGGDYYFKNVESGKFLGAANNWGTQASLTDHGHLINVTLADGKYTLGTKLYYGDNKYFNGEFMDGAATKFEVSELDGKAGQYIMKIGENYVVTEGKIIKKNGTDASKAAVWQIVPVADLISAFKQATFDNPADATFLIKGAEFSRNDNTNSAWKYPNHKDFHFSVPIDNYNDKENTCHVDKITEAWNCSFEISQEISDVPSGLYRLTVHGFDRYSAGIGDATTKVRAKLFANDVSIDMPSVNRATELTSNYEGNYMKAPDNVTQSIEAFAKGLYKSDPLYVYVADDHKLKIGIKKDEAGGWTAFDKFELAYVGNINMDAIHTELTEKLAVVINQAGKYEEDPTLQQLAVEAAKIQTDINEIGKKSAKGFEFAANYLGNGKGNLGEQIDEISKKIDIANKNFEAYEAAMEIYKGLETYRLDNLIKVYEAAQKATQEAAKDLYEKTCKLVDDFKKDAEQAYKDGTAGSVDYTIKKTEIEGAIDAANTAITKGTTNEFSYTNVKTAIAEAKNVYNDQAAKLYTLLAGASDGKIYTDTYTEALAEINSYSRQIKTIEEENNEKHEDGKCDAETQDNYTKQLAAIKAELPTVYAKYFKLVGATENPAAGSLRANYAAACADVEALTTDLEGINYGDESVKDHYATTQTEIEAKIKALLANVDKANAAHTIPSVAPFCENYNEDKKAITDAITVLKEKVAKSVTEFTADKNSQDAITKVQGKLDAAIKTAETKSEDKSYNAADKFTATATTIQDAIYAVTAARVDAYKVDGTGSAADFFTNINNNVTDEAGKVTRKGLTTIENEITAYEADAAVALAAYNTVTAALADYDLALNGKAAVGDEPAEPGLKQIAVKTAVTVD